MKILIIGAGLSGCSLARMLKDRGHDIKIVEKKKIIGGLCVTDTNMHGIKYEQYGARTFHSNNKRVIGFAKKFASFNNYIHMKGMVINNKLFPFPLTKDAINGFDDKDKIFKELENLDGKVDKTNFETTCLSVFGKTLYEYFIKNYTQKMWGIKPKELTAEWAPKRLELRDNDKDGVFAGEWQGLPEDGYSEWIAKMIKGIPIILNTTNYETGAYDVVVNTAPIDETMNYNLGRLEYRSLLFHYFQDEEWEDNNYGTINLPQHEKYIRKCNFKILHQQTEIEHNLIQYQEPVRFDKQNQPMYPVNTEANDSLYDTYLLKVCKSKNICPHGRLGLFKYLDMDEAISTSFSMVNVIENYLKLSPKQRYHHIQKIRKSI